MLRTPRLTRAAALIAVGALAASLTGCSAMTSSDIERYAAEIGALEGVARSEATVANPAPLLFRGEVEIEFDPRADTDAMAARACAFPDTPDVRPRFSVTVGTATVAQRFASACPDRDLADLVRLAEAIDAEEPGRVSLGADGERVWVTAASGAHGIIVSAAHAAAVFPQALTIVGNEAEFVGAGIGEAATALLAVDEQYPIVGAMVTVEAAHLKVQGLQTDGLAAEVGAVLGGTATTWGARTLRVEADGTEPAPADPEPADG